jgi:hypothetical protein
MSSDRLDLMVLPEEQRSSVTNDATTARAISDSPVSAERDEERETLPVAGDEKSALSIARRRKR